MKEIMNEYLRIFLMGMLAYLASWGNLYKLNAQDTLNSERSLIYAHGLEEAMVAPERVERLYIYDHEVFPREILELVNLRILGIIDGTFEEFPEEVSTLKKVELIEFGSIEYDLQVASIPRSISKFPNLKVIRLPTGTILKLSQEIGDMQQLRYLDFRHVDSVVFSKKLLQITGAYFTLTSQSVVSEGLRALPSLEHLEIEGMKYNTADFVIGSPRLRELRIYNARVPDIPIKIEYTDSLNVFEMRRGNVTLIIRELLSLDSLSSLRLVDCNVDEDMIRELHRENKIRVGSLYIKQKGFTWESDQ
jgi:hypothetical protein